MESGSAMIGKDEKRKKYHIYVEEYVLSYLKRESDSLELSEIYFYGSRQENGTKLYVYGAGRDRGIAAFSGYEPLSELVCRLTQAGPVFLVREPDGECRACGFQIFYDNNEAMQNYLLEWTGSPGRRQALEKSSGQEIIPSPAVFSEKKKKTASYSAMSVQLCLILMVLVAIVITSTDSYDKMEELSRSAKEVFFAIENQEAEEAAGDFAKQDIVVERYAEVSGAAGREEWEEEEQTQVTDVPEEDDADAEDLEEAEEQEDVLKAAEDPSGDMERQNPGNGDGTGLTQAEADTLQEKDTSAEEEAEENEAAAEQSEEKNEEALSRSITRYYEVEQGDTLYTISQKIYGDISSVEKICEANQISDPDQIRSGQRIILP